MFTTRANQENAVYEQQTAAAAKPLNQGMKGLAPKTPGNNISKTPFRIQRNDENTRTAQGKAGEKETKEARIRAFVTPANPRNRAPLGIKTANTKLLKSPARPDTNDEDHPSTTKPTSPRLRRSKIKVHVGEAAGVLAAAPEEREIEYMAPREIPRPDFPDDIWSQDRDYSVLQGRNFTRGWSSAYAHDKEDDHSDFEEKCARMSKVASTRGVNEARRQALNSNIAASALSSANSRGRGFGVHGIHAAPKARQPVVVKKPSPSERNPRFTAAKAASNSTIGYSKGRAVSVTTKLPLSDLHSSPIVGGNLPGSKIDSSTAPSLLESLGLGSLSIAGEAGNERTHHASNSGDEADALDDFQLAAPEGL